MSATWLDNQKKIIKGRENKGGKLNFLHILFTYKGDWGHKGIIIY
jgi:hypothetical protein